MATSSKVKRRWNNENYDRIYLSVMKGDKEKIRAVANKLGLSLNMFIQEAIADRMKREQDNE